MKVRILIAEGDPHVALVVARGLAERLAGETRVVAGGRAAVRLARIWEPHVVVLDLGLTDGQDGYATARAIREFSNAGIVILTGRCRESEKLLGFASGADDYVTKPFSLAELAARCRAVLRRATPFVPVPPATVHAGPVLIDLASGQVSRAGQPVHLTRTERQLLLALARQPGKIIPVEDLLLEVWGPAYRAERGYVEVYVSRLRNKLEDNRRAPALIVTCAPLGYQLRGE